MSMEIVVPFERGGAGVVELRGFRAEKFGSFLPGFGRLRNQVYSVGVAEAII